MVGHPSRSVARKTSPRSLGEPGRGVEALQLRHCAARFPISSASSRLAQSSGASPSTSSLPAGSSSRAGLADRLARLAHQVDVDARRGRRSRPRPDGRRSRAPRSRRRRSGTHRRSTSMTRPSYTRVDPIRSIAPPYPSTAAGQRSPRRQRRGEEQRVLGDRPPHRLGREPACPRSRRGRSARLRGRDARCRARSAPRAPPRPSHPREPARR